MPLIFVLLLNPINDISTSFSPPPHFEEVTRIEKDRDFNWDSSKEKTQLKLYPDLGPLFISQSGEIVFKHLMNATEYMPTWKIHITNTQRMRIEGTATTPTLKFKDDFVIEVRNVQNGCEVHMRSKSRLGRSDFGANAKRITNYFRTVNDLVLGKDPNARDKEKPLRIGDYIN